MGHNGKIGRGYGSEWHLLRYLGYHRGLLTEQVKSKIGAQEVHWLDFEFTHKNEDLSRDQEWDGLDFIQNADVQRCILSVQWKAVISPGTYAEWDNRYHHVLYTRWPLSLLVKRGKRC